MAEKAETWRRGTASKSLRDWRSTMDAYVLPQLGKMLVGAVAIVLGFEPPRFEGGRVMRKSASVAAAVLLFAVAGCWSVSLQPWPPEVSAVHTDTEENVVVVRVDPNEAVVWSGPSKMTDAQVTRIVVDLAVPEARRVCAEQGRVPRLDGNRVADTMTTRIGNTMLRYPTAWYVDFTCTETATR